MASERDSLLQKLLTSRDSSKLDALLSLSQLYSRENPDSSLLLARQAVVQANKSNDANRLAKAHANLGLQLKRQKAYMEANMHYRLAIKGYQKTGDQIREAAMLANIGIVYKNTAQYDSSLIIHLQALALREKLGDAAEIANSQSSIAQLYIELEEYDKALYFQKAALALYRKSGNLAKAASVSSDIGLVYYKIENYPLALKQFREVEKTYRKLVDEEGLAFVFNNQAMVFQKQALFEEAITRYEASLAIKTKLNDERGIIRTLYNLGSCYFDQQKTSEAIEYLEKARKKALAIDYKNALVEIYDLLSSCFEKQANYKAALKFRTAFASLSDSLLDIAKSEQMAEMQARYETEKSARALEKQSAELALQLARSAKNQQQRNFLAAILVLALVLSWLTYSRIKYKQQLALEKLKIDQQEIAHRVIIETEEKERIRISRELHDGVGQQMAALKLNLGLLSDQLTLNSLQQEKMTDLIALAHDASKEVRSVSHSLMPNALLRSGLAIAVREFLQQLSNERIKIDFEVVGLNERLSHPQELALFRVIQESMSNIMKHAAASVVSIQLIRHADEINLLIEDNGKGFVTANQNDSGGLGLKNIVNRIRELGGEVDFDSLPGRGTIVNVHLKL